MVRMMPGEVTQAFTLLSAI